MERNLKGLLAGFGIAGVLVTMAVYVQPATPLGAATGQSVSSTPTLSPSVIAQTNKNFLDSLKGQLARGGMKLSTVEFKDGGTFYRVVSINGVALPDPFFAGCKECEPIVFEY